ncbi:adenine deaminase [Blautia sp. MSJ-19]|uniref:adenine deaminase n=1 Tax=Blautia sp. MSJ-19 TaxID=2841517 RepID=UPI001C0ECEDE|nr:adenine deaminase [Blautia sp. MSJ-19]MBU5482198.1 adenine deaminase [Blautia sp. MSJ-19]
MELKKYRRYSEITRGLKKAELVLKNAKIVNVFTGELVNGDIAIEDGMIVGIGSYEGETERDVTGKYICPGFIDSHLHLESTLVTPGELITVASQHGTTTFIVDPHESANVSGLAGIDYIIDQTENVSANVFVMMPSCVPATSIDDNGCTLTAEDMAPYLEKQRVLGLGEVMDYISVVNGDIDMHQKLTLFESRVRDGHAPFLAEQDLQAYAMAGIKTDHECSDFEYAMSERRNGMTILIREGSAARNIDAIVSGLVQNHMNGEGFCFCTDDKHIEDIEREGHIDHNVRRAIELGMNPIDAIKMATIHSAECYGLHNMGAVAPGYQADLLVLDDLEKVSINDVYYKGKVIKKDKEIALRSCPSELKNTVHVGRFSEDDLKLESPDGCFTVIKMQDGQITTKKQKKIFSDKPCSFKADKEFQKIAVIERHRATGKTGVGIVSGFGIQGGAIASSVSHDSHNIIVIGDNDEDMKLAVEELIRVQGGYTIISDHKVFDTLELPVMGLMSDAGYRYSNHKLKIMIDKAHKMGVRKGIDPFITLSFMALPVIPEIRITPRGIYDVLSGDFYQN